MRKTIACALVACDPDGIPNCLESALPSMGDLINKAMGGTMSGLNGLRPGVYSLAVDRHSGGWQSRILVPKQGHTQKLSIQWRPQLSLPVEKDLPPELHETAHTVDYQKFGSLYSTRTNI